MEPANDPPAEHVIDAAQIFRGARTVLLQWEGTVYQLRITRRNKLLLIKPRERGEEVTDSDEK